MRVAMMGSGGLGAFFGGLQALDLSLGEGLGVDGGWSVPHPTRSRASGATPLLA
jgi:hypothetical protein